MLYHTALVTQAGQRFPVTIGGRRFVARPISVPVMLHVMAAIGSGDATRTQAAHAALLRAAFPRPRFGWRDPLRWVARLDAPALGLLIRRLTRIPHDAPPDVADDPRAAMAARQRAAVQGATRATHGPRPTLLLAAQACRAAFGHAWYYAPNEYDTVDGYVPHDVCWLEFAGLSALDARAQLTQVHAHAVATSGKKAEQALRSLLAQAYPTDPLTTAPRGGWVH